MLQQLARLHQLGRPLRDCTALLHTQQGVYSFSQCGQPQHGVKLQQAHLQHSAGKHDCQRQPTGHPVSHHSPHPDAQLPVTPNRTHPWQHNSNGSIPWLEGRNTIQLRGMHSAARLPLDRLQEAITPAVCDELSAKGYAVVDGVFGGTMSHQLEQELVGVWQQGLMHINHTHLVNKGQTTLLAKSKVMEAELTLDPTIRQAAPLVAQLDADTRLQTMLNLFIPQLRLEAHAIKMQHNEGSGGCFPMHFDSDELLDGRRVTAIFYLNQGWQLSHGGELQLYPFPAPPVDIPPLQDRLVLFASTRMLHRVLPSNVPRSCFTMWLSEGRAKAAGVSGPPVLSPPSSGGQAGAELWQFLMQPAIRQHVCKLAYADEWERSIQESHPNCPDTDAALAKHRQEVAAISKALNRCQPGLQQLLSAAALVQRVEQEHTDGRSHSGSAVSEEQLQKAVGLLQQVAAHVKWF